jgi:leucyl aminopeptidase
MTVTYNQNVNNGDWICYLFDKNNAEMNDNSLFERLEKSFIDVLSKDDTCDANLVYKMDNPILLIYIQKDIQPGQLFNLIRKTLIKNRNVFQSVIHLSLDKQYQVGNQAWSEAILQGFFWSQYVINKETGKALKPMSLNILTPHDNGQLKETVKRAEIVSTIQMQVADLVNLPSNKKTPYLLSDKLRSWLGEKDLVYKIFRGEELNKEKLHAIYEVGKASDFEPAFVIVEYRNPKSDTTIGLIGKGITFDTGGLSIKPSSNMHYMKCDMAGAAAMIGAFKAVVECQLPIDLILMIPLAENVINGNSLKPGDVINSYSGKTIEIIDTDAEGRLVLADALAFMSKNYEVDYLIDMATLTGSIVSTLGYEAAGLFSNSEKLNTELTRLGNIWEEKIWPMPLWDSYKEDLHSDVADLRNFSGKPIAGSITAAKFLQEFTDEHPNWAHLDIAGVAFKDSEFGKMKNASAYGVRLIFELISVFASPLSKKS